MKIIYKIKCYKSHSSSKERKKQTNENEENVYKSVWFY